MPRRGAAHFTEEDLTGVIIDRKNLSLHDVAINGQYKQIAKVLKQRSEYPVDINEQDASGRTPLMYACMHGHEKVAAFLLQQNANSDYKDVDGLAAIHYAAIASGDPRIGLSCSAALIRQIVQHGGEVDRKTVDGRTAVHLAVLNKCVDVLTILRDQGADLNKFSTEGYNAIYFACKAAVKEKSVSGIIQLLKYGLDINAADPHSGKTTLHRAADEDIIEILRFLVLEGADVALQDHDGRTIFHIATQRGSLKAMQAIVDSMKGEREEGGEHRHAVDDDTKTRIANGLSVQDKWGNTPLHVACAYGYQEVVTLLLREGSDPYIANFTKADMGELSDAGASDGEEESEDEQTAEEAAAAKAREAAVETGGGKTPYHVSTEIGHTNIFKAFVRRGLDTSHTDAGGNTVLHFAAMNNDCEIAELQLEVNPEADEVNNAGWSPLHYAAAYDALNMIVLLLDKGADPNLANLAGQTPLQLATRSRTKKAVMGLLKAELEREAADKALRLVRPHTLPRAPPRLRPAPCARRAPRAPPEAEPPARRRTRRRSGGSGWTRCTRTRGCRRRRPRRTASP